MNPLLALLLSSAPCIYWTGGAETLPALQAASVRTICVASDQADLWRPTGVTAMPIATADLAAREALPVPGVTSRAGLASPTRMPFVVASGWRLMRNPAGRFVYTLPAGKGALGMAEAFVYGGDAILRIDPADLPATGAMAGFLAGLPPSDLPPVADIAVIDDGSPITGEVMNLLARRNLLFQVVKTPPAGVPVAIGLGSPEYPVASAADPSAFALRVRRQLTDERRSLRIFGSEVVLGRLTAGGGRARLHLLNYGGREILGLRVRLRGRYRTATAHVAGVGVVPVEDQAAQEDATEFSLPRILTAAVIDLE